MQIRLGNSFMWFLPDASVHLSEENPGPIEIDFDNLSSDNKNIIKIGINTGQIIGTLPQEIKTEQLIKPTEVVKDIYERDNILAGKLQVILNQRIPNIKIEIGKMNDSRLLNTILTLEENGKNRKTIVSLIQSKLHEVSSAVLASIVEVNTNANVDQLDSLSRSFASEIEDIEETEVIIPLEELNEIR